MKYKVYYNLTPRIKTKIKLPKEEVVEANSFNEVRQMVRDKFGYRASNIIVELIEE